MDGLHDPDSPLNMLRWLNDVRDPVMRDIWNKVTEDWEVFSKFTARISSSSSSLIKRLCHRDPTSGLRRRRLLGCFDFLLNCVEEHKYWVYPIFYFDPGPAQNFSILNLVAILL